MILKWPYLEKYLEMSVEISHSLCPISIYVNNNVDMCLLQKSGLLTPNIKKIMIVFWVMNSSHWLIVIPVGSL